MNTQTSIATPAPEASAAPAVMANLPAKNESREGSQPCSAPTSRQEKRTSLSAGILRHALVCEEGRQALSGTTHFDRLTDLLRRWQELDFPDPELEPDGTLLLEFERFLDSLNQVTA